MFRYASAFAVAALAVVSLAPTAIADCPHKGKFEHPHCGGEPPPPLGATLGDLSCSTDQIAKYDGTNWVCSTDTVGALGCSSGQVAKFNGVNWACAADENTLADLPSCLEGDVAKFDGSIWECVTSGGDINFVLMDCADLACGRDPQQVGTVVGLTGLSGVLVLLTIPDSLGQPRNIVLQVTRAKINNAGSGVWFDDVDCSESANAWIWLEPGDVGIAAGSSGSFFPPAIEDYSIVSDTADMAVRSLWVAMDDTVFDGTSVSKAESQGCTSPEAQTFSGVPAEKIANDLHTDFPPPYTLEIQ